MTRRIGIIQSGGIGDIVIAIPIADFFVEKGYEVVWPVYASYVEAFRRVKQNIRFLSVPKEPASVYEVPRRMLRDEGCEQVYSLYSFLKEAKVYDEALAWSLKFDEYKYAITGVPFALKWKLQLQRDREREKALHHRLNIARPYICVHDSGSNFKVSFGLPAGWAESYQIVNITELTDSPFDWLYTLEHASKLMLLDSCFSNLVEQLNLPNEKYLITRSSAQFTPVFINYWRRLVMEGSEGNRKLRLV